MDIQRPTNSKGTTTGLCSDMGEFFPDPVELKPVNVDDLKTLNFRGKRLDLEVYHLAYGTKKLKACTYRRMMRRQKQKNNKKAKDHTAKSPYDICLKAKKMQWLNSIQKIVEQGKLKAPEKIIRNRRISKKQRNKNKAEYQARVAKRLNKLSIMMANE